MQKNARFDSVSHFQAMILVMPIRVHRAKMLTRSVVVMQDFEASDGVVRTNQQSLRRAWDQYRRCSSLNGKVSVRSLKEQV
jgi:hypothetical protein